MEEKKLTIRLPKELHDRLVALAKQDTRSLNGEIVALLREATATRAQQPPATS